MLIRCYLDIPECHETPQFWYLVVCTSNRPQCLFDVFSLLVVHKHCHHVEGDVEHVRLVHLQSNPLSGTGQHPPLTSSSSISAEDTVTWKVMKYFCIQNPSMQPCLSNPNEQRVISHCLIIKEPNFIMTRWGYKSVNVYEEEGGALPSPTPQPGTAPARACMMALVTACCSCCSKVPSRFCWAVIS